MLKNHLVEQICQAAGGPCTYKRQAMRTAHAGMGITPGHFTALVEDLVAAKGPARVAAGWSSPVAPWTARALCRS